MYCCDDQESDDESCIPVPPRGTARQRAMHSFHPLDTAGAGSSNYNPTTELEMTRRQA